MKTAGVKASVIFLLGWVTACSGASDAHDGKQKDLDIGQQDQKAIIENLKSILVPDGKVARIYFNEPCDAEDGHHMPFPSIKVRFPKKDQKGLEAVQEMFRDNSNIEISEDRVGIVTIKIGQVSGEVLLTKLPPVLLSQQAQYNVNGPGNAIDTIENTAEFRAAAARLNTKQLSVFYDSIQLPAVDTLPHLNASLGGATVDETLDLIAKTFQGVVLYGECRASNGAGLFDIEFKRFPKK